VVVCDASSGASAPVLAVETKKNSEKVGSSQSGSGQMKILDCLLAWTHLFEHPNPLVILTTLSQTLAAFCIDEH
jgi:hypothetical protein